MLVVVLTMILRRNVVIPCIVFTFLIGLVYTGNLITAVQAVFNASLVAAKELFGIFLIISLMVAMLKSISATGGDELLVKPMSKLMVSPLVSYIVVCVATVIISLFFWPTPAVPLIGALLVPAAVRAGLPPMLGAVALALAGQAMTLAGDVIIQGAPGLTAASAGVATELVTWKGGLLTLIAGAVAIPLGYILNREDIRNFQHQKAETAATAEMSLPVGQAEEKKVDLTKGKFLVYLLIAAMIGVVVSMFGFDIKGGDASALLGGVALLIMLVATVTIDGIGGFDKMADYVADGLVFAFKVMGPIIPIAGFFFLGNPEVVVNILGDGAPGFLFDVGEMVAKVIPPTGFMAAFGLLILGAITGLDGSGFSGLPVVGTLAGAMASGDANVAATLGSLGQLGAIWVGGGALVAWSSLVAVAGIVGVPVLDLVRKNTIPVIAGLVVATIFAVLFMM
ncbi:hypothetical protein TepRe1_0243 [Calderihabitans maritimus]|uniref:Transporter n=1 Tax=Calderihabitans maritimus TaxID=1246530 RepID=A0A1Z5HSI5_9FIRM|nr:hypothetical protein TepRe1_0243 [Calderihabitans maritimus]